jgi:hypothetical protein
MERYPFTPDGARLIVSLVRAGASLPYAAEAAGIPRRVFGDWLARGRLSEEPPFGPFYRQVLAARGQARTRAETEVLQKDPKFWLRYGPAQAAAKKGRRAPPTAISHLLIELVPLMDSFAPEVREAIAACVELAENASEKRRETA